jgi:putative transposase
VGETYDVTRMAGLLGVSRSGFYAWKHRHTAPAGPRAARREQLTAKIVEFHAASPG